MKHAQTVHALKIYLETGPFSPDISYYSEKQSALSEGRNTAIVDSSKYDTDLLSYMPQESVGLEGAVTFVLKNTLSSGLQVFPATDVDVAAQDQFSNLSENFENMPPEVHSGHRKSLSADGELEQISGDLSLQTASSESRVEDVENVSIHSAVLGKCCSSVLPKKRKRHMEIKHGSSRKRSPIVSSGPTSIYIDLEPGSEGHSFQASVSHDAVQNSITAAETESVNMPRPSLRRRSVIIQPGMTFSIPVSHTSASLAPSCSYPVAANSTTTTATGLPEQKSTNEEHIQDASVLGSKPRGSDTVTCDPVLEAADSAGEQKNSVDDSFHDGFLGEEQGQGKTLEHRRRRYPTSRPFKCDQCDNAFNQRIHLKKHQSKHTGNVAFCCCN